MKEFVSTCRSVCAFLERMMLVWRQNWWSVMLTNVVNPLIFMLAFGFGVGAFIPEIDGMPYFNYVVSGMMAQGIMFTVTFETTIEAFYRFDRQRTWYAILATPVNLKGLLAGEALWATIKGMVSGLSVFAVGAVFAGVALEPRALLVIPFLFLGGLCLATCGLFFSSFARTFLFFSITFTFWITPMFMFCSVLFPVSRFPEWLQTVAWWLPMTHIVALIRPFAAGVPITAAEVGGHTLYLIALTVITFGIGYYRMRQRIFD